MTTAQPMPTQPMPTGSTPLERCRCGELEHLDDDAAIAYSQGHLRLERVAGDAWSSDWRCPVSGACWLERYHLSWGASRRSVSLERVAPPIGEPLPRRRLPARSGPRATGTPTVSRPSVAGLVAAAGATRAMAGRYLLLASATALAAYAGAGLIA